MLSYLFVKKRKDTVRAIVVAILLLGALIFFYALKGKNEFYMSSLNKVSVVGLSLVAVVCSFFRPKIKLTVSVVFDAVVIIVFPIFLFNLLEPLVNDMSIYNKEYSIYNILVISLVVWLIYALSMNSGIAVLIGGYIFYLFYIIDYFASQFRNVPLYFSDFRSWKTTLGVARSYAYILNSSIVICFYIIATIGLFALMISSTTKKVKLRLITFGIVFIPTLVVNLLVFGTDYLAIKEISSNTYVPLETAHVNGLLFNNVIAIKNSSLKPPVGYSDAVVSQIMGNYRQERVIVDDKKYPNIIIIMNESFTDPEFFDGILLSEDPIPKFRAMEENCIRGTVISSVLGGNTPNSEFELLTGNTMAFLPEGMIAYQQIIDRDMPTMASELKKLGYTSTAIHLFNPEYFERNRIYPLFGFDKFITSENATVNVEILRDYPTDESCFNQIIDLYENKDNSPMFVFCPTIQNHGGYWWGMHDIELENYSNDYADEYLSILKITDDSFSEFVNYFSKVDEPTIICMYGDHQPFFGDEFYDEVLIDNSDELKTRYTQAKTPFVIWANYDIEEKAVGDISINNLGALLLETAGVPMSDYYTFINELRKELPVSCAVCFLDYNGNRIYDIVNSEYADRIYEYKCLQFFYLKENNDDSFFDVMRSSY